MRVAAYLRVSTDRQAEQGFGLDVQRKSIRSWAKAAGHRVVAWYSDEGVSGSNGVESRVGLLDVFEAVRAGRAEGLVVYRLDRLARDLVVQEQVLAELWRLGAEVCSTMPGEAVYLHRDDPEDPSRKLIRQVLGAVSEYERAMITARLRAGRRRKAEQGGFAYGSPPFGKRAVDGVLVDDESEAEALALILQRRASGESYRSICKLLHEARHKPRRGGTWEPATVRKIVERAGSG